MLPFIYNAGRVSGIDCCDDPPCNITRMAQDATKRHPIVGVAAGVAANDKEENKKGNRNFTIPLMFWQRGLDLNQRPSGYGTAWFTRRVGLGD